jgi:hypothetical protein
MAAEYLRVTHLSILEEIKPVSVSSNAANLWLCVIEQAMLDLSTTAGHDAQIVRADARAWFISQSSNFGSLNWICTQLDLSATAIRKAVLNQPIKSRKSRDRLGRSSVGRGSIRAALG